MRGLIVLRIEGLENLVVKHVSSLMSSYADKKTPGQLMLPFLIAGQNMGVGIGRNYPQFVECEGKAPNRGHNMVLTTAKIWSLSQVG